MNYNFEYWIVFSPLNPKEYQGRKRFFVSANQLSNYIGAQNARNVLEKVLDSRADSITYKFRAHGKVQFYSK